jgi:Zn-dependent protease
MASVRVGRLGDTPVTVEAGVAVLAALFVALLATEGFARVAPESGLALRVVVSTITVAVFLGSVLAHEMGHAAMAKRFDVRVLGVTLSLFGGYAQLERQAPTPTAEFAIAAAGPAVNLGLGAALGGAVAALNLADVGSGTIGAFVVAACFWLAAVNLTLAVLNLAPAAPLDGGRLVTAWLWHRSGDGEWARVQSGRLGLVLGLALAVGGLVQTAYDGPPGLVTLVVGLFLFQGARREIVGATLRRRLASTTAADMMVGHPMPVAADLPLDRLPELVGPGLSGVGLPVARWGQEPIGYVVATATVERRPEHSWTSARSRMHRADEVARAWSTEPLDTVLRRFSDRRELLIVVHEPRVGAEVGTLTNHQLTDILRPPDTWGRTRPVSSPTDTPTSRISR